MVTLGSNRFTNVVVLLAFGDRYFIVEQDHPPVLSVLHQTPSGLQWEILRDVPGTSDVAAVTTNPTGTVTVTDRATDRFIQKLRPGATEASLVFGKVQGGEQECVVSGRSIRIGTSTFDHNSIADFAVGIRLTPEGDIEIGGGRLPEPVLNALRARA